MNVVFFAHFKFQQFQVLIPREKTSSNFTSLIAEVAMKKWSHSGTGELIERAISGSDSSLLRNTVVLDTFRQVMHSH